MKKTLKSIAVTGQRTSYNVGDVFDVQAIDKYSLGSDTYKTLVNFSFQVLRVTFTKRGLAIAGVIVAKNYDFLN